NVCEGVAQGEATGSQLKHPPRILLPRGGFPRETSLLGLFHRKLAHDRISLSAASNGASRHVAVIGDFLVDLIQLARALNEAQHGVPPDRRTAIDDRDRLHGL